MLTTGLTERLDPQSYDWGWTKTPLDRSLWSRFGVDNFHMDFTVGLDKLNPQSDD
jgi:hypothetical protein